MITTSARLLRLLGLLQQRQLWAGRDLADRLEITERTVRRDIERLRTLGYPVQQRLARGRRARVIHRVRQGRRLCHPPPRRHRCPPAPRHRS
ncbi:MAG: helix-turn-helix domain-containing protein [Geodermatophilaceae bacterium]|nr:helix-turn-helix domain-containing protein [Geodermatophilaceae bacterium]